MRSPFISCKKGTRRIGRVEEGSLVNRVRIWSQVGTRERSDYITGRGRLSTFFRGLDKLKGVTFLIIARGMKVLPR